jgi:hypothetical protein
LNFFSQNASLSALGHNLAVECKALHNAIDALWHHDGPQKLHICFQSCCIESRLSFCVTSVFCYSHYVHTYSHHQDTSVSPQRISKPPTATQQGSLGGSNLDTRRSSSNGRAAHSISPQRSSTQQSVPESKQMQPPPHGAPLLVRGVVTAAGPADIQDIWTKE